jgi:O-antigen/teichoic acid export membrane protein
VKFLAKSLSIEFGLFVFLVSWRTGSLLSELRQNLVANLVGRAWTMFLGVAFIPVYLRFLGMEAYGLVGFFATVQGVFGLLDLGLGSTINRELARLSTTTERRDIQRSLLRTLEIFYWSISLAAGCFIVLLAPTIAHQWVRVSTISPLVVERAVRIMGFVLALQLPFSFYQSALMGMQHQVALNVIVIATATARSAGTALVLWQVSASVEAFFVCQLAITLIQTAITVGAVWSALGGALHARPHFAHFVSVWRYAAATSANAVLGAALTQTDKVLLSRLLTLEQFAYYSLAGTLASVVWAIVIPVNQALFPRFAQLVERNEQARLAALYHRASQIMVVALVPAAATVAFFSWQIMFLWTRDSVAADQTALITSLLIAGAAINGVVSVPGYLQAAAGWPALMVYTNCLAAIVLVPAILIVTPTYGATGAAFVWLVLNSGYLVFNVPVMHRRLLRGEQISWYRDDVGRPVVAALAVAIIGRVLMPDLLSMWMTAAWIAGVGLLTLLACAAWAPQVRYVLARP